MFEALVGFLVDAADVTATVTVLVALWEGRISYGSDRLLEWVLERPEEIAISTIVCARSGEGRGLDTPGTGSGCFAKMTPR